MNYEKLYYLFVNKFKNQMFDDEYTEVHHIIPRHAGGDDSEENLVEVTYRQHVFLHKLLFKAYRRPQDLAAYNLMSRIDKDKKIILCSMAGKIGGRKNAESGHIQNLGKLYGKQNGLRCVESGQLDRIRHLANNETQRKKVSYLGKLNVETGFLAEVAKIAYKVRADKSELRSNKVIETAERNEEFLHKTSSRSSYNYISPEGLIFCSAHAAAGYYGNEKPNVINSWCDRERFGWKRVSKQ